MMEVSTILFLLLGSLGAAFVQRVSGFGFGIFIMTILPYLMPSYGEATTLSGLMALVTSLIIATKMYRFLQWRKLLPILVTFLVVSYFAVWFVSMANDGLLKKILGAILILASIYFFWISDKVKLRATMPVQIVMGVLSGVMGGLFGMQGPPAVLYFIACTERKEEYMAMAQTYFLVGNVMMTLYRAQSGFLTESVLLSWCYCVPAVLLGTWLGTVVFKRISVKVLRKVIYAYMAVSGVVAML